MRDSIEGILVELLRRRLGQAGPFPAELYRFVTRTAQARGMEESAWLHAIESRPDDLAALLSAATIGHTQFYRHGEHFEQLRRALPNLIARSSPLRVWSAGCSTGEEVWSIALTLHGQGVPFQLLATDVNPRAVERARRGLYAAHETRHLPGYDGALAFDAAPAVRAHVRFEVMSLLDELPRGAPSQFDVVFCRNVLIYLDAQHLQAVWRRFESVLAPWGAMAVAPVESLTGVPARLARRGPLGWLESAAAPPAAVVRARRTKSSSIPRAALSQAQTPPDKDTTAQALEEVGRYMAAGNTTAAEQVLHSLLATRDDALGWFLLGEACARRGATSQARIAFERASVAQLTSGDTDLGTIRAAALRRAKQFAQ